MTFASISELLAAHPWLQPFIIFLGSVVVVVLIIFVIIFIHAYHTGRGVKFFGIELKERKGDQPSDPKANAAPTSISGCTKFFTEQAKHRELRVFAMSGQRFLETIRTNRISVDSIKIIAPSDDALKAYFGSNANAIEVVSRDIDNNRNGTTANKLSGLVRKLETKRIGSFPLTFYAIFSEQLAMSGVYAVDELREHTIGLKSRAWLDSDKNSVDEKLSQFDALWEIAV